MSKRSEATSMTAALKLTRGACIALIGAGGKTTTMLALRDDTVRAGMAVVVTTTTRIWAPDDMPIVLAKGDVLPAGATPPVAGSAVAVGSAIDAAEKLLGIPSDLVCSMHRKRWADVILCEADGAAGRSLKAHQPGEPVVPACSTAVLVVAGVDAVGAELRDNVVHRPERFSSAVGASPGDRLTPRHVALGLKAAAAHAPARAQVIFILNKVDDEAAHVRARGVAAALANVHSGAEIALTAWGRPPAPESCLSEPP